jgi:hypothetical protein
VPLFISKRDTNRLGKIYLNLLILASYHVK